MGWVITQTFRTHSPEETLALGRQLGQGLKPNSVLCFTGDLGAGKTTLIKGIVEGATGVKGCQVTSPTFVYLNIYPGEKTVYHFDLYRLENGEEFFNMGFDEMFTSNGICCVEWSERIAPWIADDFLKVHLDHLAPEEREITLTGKESDAL